MIRFRFWRSVEDAASAEAWASPQPGYYDGPADAYRHIVGTAEARRRYGFGTAYALATANEMLVSTVSPAKAWSLLPNSRFEVRVIAPRS